MKRVSILVAILAIAVAFASIVGAQGLRRLRLASGSQGGTYYTMALNMKTYCDEGVSLDVQQTGGADENIAALMANKADIAIVQKDILFKRSKYGNDQAVKNFLAVMPLHPEAMHLIVLEKSGMTKFSQFGATKGRLGGLLGGNPAKKVAAYGGSIESAEIIKAMTEVNFELVVVADRKAALGALSSGQVDAVLAMGGVPMEWVEKELQRGVHRLVEFDASYETVQGAYKRSNLTYSKLGVNGLKTIATDAVLITRNFTTPEKVQAVSLLRKCVWTKLNEMKEADDTHGQWQNVERDQQVEGWSWFAGTQVTWPPAGAPVRKK